MVSLRKGIIRFINQLYNFSDTHRYIILFGTGLTHTIFSIIIFLFFKFYLLVVICFLGGVYFCVMYKHSHMNNFKKMFYGILAYSYLIELPAAYFLEWEMGYQNFLFVLIPLSFTFLYLNDNYDEIIPSGIQCSAFVMLCYLLCSFIDFWAKPNSGATLLEIRIINAVTSVLIISMLFSCIIIFIIELYATHHKLLEQTNLQLDALRSSIMLSQIKPHFLYNTMAAIEEMIDTDPARAKKEMASFFRYMRMNIDTLSSNELVPFEKELEHIKAYMQIQKMRFGDMISMKYDLAYTAFQLPPLTIQPIVENAIKHGIRPKGGHGVIELSTWTDGNSYFVNISDDGVGLDLKKPCKNAGSTGLYNIDYRLKNQCYGCMKIESELGIGTTITIVIPKRR